MDTFFRHRQLSALGDLDRLDRFVARTLLTVLDLLDDVVALYDLAKDDVAAIQPAADELWSASDAVCNVLGRRIHTP